MVWIYFKKIKVLVTGHSVPLIFLNSIPNIGRRRSEEFIAELETVVRVVPALTGLLKINNRNIVKL